MSRGMSKNATLAGVTERKRRLEEVERGQEEEEEGRVVGSPVRKRLCAGGSSSTLWALKTFVPLRSTKRLTVPQSPFTSSTTRRTPKRKTPKKYVSLAEAMQRMQSKTPERFHSTVRRRLLGETPREKRGFWLPRRTLPRTPKFATKFRARQSTVIPTAEREALAFANTIKFKAKPVDRRALESDGMLGVKPVPRQPPVVPEDVRLHTEERAKERQERSSSVYSQTCTQPFVFKATPLDRTMFEGVHGVPPKHVEPPTVPQTPKFLTDERLGPKVVVTAEPRKAAEIMRTLSRTGAPSTRNGVTVPEPFHFVVEARIQERHAQEHQENRQQVVTDFKATAYVPKNPTPLAKSTRPLTRIDNFTLNTDRQAVKRAQFDEALAAKQRQAEELHKLKDEEESAREKVEIKELRKLLVHRPQPVLPDSVVQVRRSTKPVTVPKSPYLLSKRRATLHASATTCCGRDW